MKQYPQDALPLHERLLFLADAFPFGALYRVAIGYLFLFLFDRVADLGAARWEMLLWFLALLLLLRVVPAVVRKLLPFSEGVQSAWATRRMMAKRFDSYQWQKLLWFGIGMGAYCVFSERVHFVQGFLTAFCLIGGGLGLWTWRKRQQQFA